MRRGWESWDYLAWEEKNKGNLGNVLKYMMGGSKEDEAWVLLAVSSEMARGNGCKVKYRNIHKHKK